MKAAQSHGFTIIRQANGTVAGAADGAAAAGAGKSTPGAETAKVLCTDALALLPKTNTQ